MGMKCVSFISNQTSHQFIFSPSNALPVTQFHSSVSYWHLFSPSSSARIRTTQALRTASKRAKERNEAFPGTYLFLDCCRWVRKRCSLFNLSILLSTTTFVSSFHEHQFEFFQKCLYFSLVCLYAHTTTLSAEPIINSIINSFFIGLLIAFIFCLLTIIFLLTLTFIRHFLAVLFY